VTAIARRRARGWFEAGDEVFVEHDDDASNTGDRRRQESAMAENKARGGRQFPYTGIGVGIGAGGGATIGVLIGGGAGIAVGLCLGAGLGVAIGAAMDALRARMRH
jgi:hypothetical protein